MTGPDRPVRQPANTRARILHTCFLRLAAFPCMPETRTFIKARGGGDSIINLPGSFPAAAARSGGRIVRAVGDGYTAALANWAPAGRPVRPPGGVCTGWKRRVMWKGGARDGDSGSALPGAGRGWRGVPGAGRAAPAGVAGALLPDAGLVRRCRGRRPGDDAGR